MGSIFSRFYFLSKLTTSLILLILVIFLFYLFVKAYLQQNITKQENFNFLELSSNLSILSQNVEKNSKNLNLITDLVKENSVFMKKIDIDLKKTNIKNNDDLLIELKKIKDENNNLQKEISKLNLIVNKLPNINSENILVQHKTKSIKNIVKLIKLKIENGSSFIDEVDLLREISVDEQYLSNIEKLSIFSSNTFVGINELNKSFDKISTQYLNDYYSKKNKNYFVKKLLNVVSLQPNKNSNIKDKNVLILSNAKKHLLNKDLNKTINQLDKLYEGEYFFSKWIDEAKYYDDVMNLLIKL
tara:strand:+ start:1859 stop:2758 length:900 start_codon:yes stop_codon:yes gene_type:complete